jgi:hypothetical protein
MTAPSSIDPAHFLHEQHPGSAAGAGLLPAGGTAAPLVCRRHPAGPAGRRQRHRPPPAYCYLHELLSARGH